VIIEYHYKYMTHLAKRYISIYSKYGYKEASKWYDTFLTKGLRDRIRPFIKEQAQEQNLEMD